MTHTKKGLFLLPRPIFNKNRGRGGVYEYNLVKGVRCFRIHIVTLFCQESLGLGNKNCLRVFFYKILGGGSRNVVGGLEML